MRCGGVELPGLKTTWVSGGSIDGFLTKLNRSGTALLYSTFIGGSLPDGAVAIALVVSRR